jgi:N-acetylglucosaminyl-diphospho-decaprenol L-rhamnosyltransferase
VSGPSAAASSPRVSAVVVSYNTRDLLLRCLDALHAHARVPFETIVVDNASADGSAEAVRARFPAARVIANPSNLGFSRANNLALREARGELVLVLNSDCEVGPGAVEAMSAILEARLDVAIVGPRTVGADGRPQMSFGPRLTPVAEWWQRRLVRGVKEGRTDALREVASRTAGEQEPDWVSASCLLARRRVLEAVGGFDESFFLYEEDVDLCLRVRAAGWRVVYTPTAEVVHHLGRSMDQAPGLARLEYHRSHLRFYRKHNPLSHRVALRAWMAAGAARAWLRAGGGDGGQRRQEEAAILRLALFG